MGYEVHQEPVVWHVAFHVWVRPVRPPEFSARKLFNQFPSKRHDIPICGLFPAERLGPLFRQALGTGDLGNDVGVLPHQFDEQRKLFSLDGPSNVWSAHMIDNKSSWEDGEETPELGQVVSLKVDNHVPSQLRDTTGDLLQFILGREVYKPHDKVEADGTHA